MFFAHSPAPERGIPAQEYCDHVKNVSRLSRAFASILAPYCPYPEILGWVVAMSSEYHDLGKLEESNQEVLSGKRPAKKLPFRPHEDPGTAFLLRNKNTQGNSLAAFLTYSHHKGLTDLGKESAKAHACFRDFEIKELVDKKLDIFIEKHTKTVKTSLDNLNLEGILQENLGVFLRVALSCLVDADHTDTACHYGNLLETENSYTLSPLNRLKKLNDYIKSLQKATSSQRDQIRSEMYTLCSASPLNPGGIFSCDSPVGTGKTTAIMANLLRIAHEKGLRRIFVVLPYTNIIDQSVATYRKSLCLSGENPEQTVAAHHHRADFQDPLTRHFTTRWDAPIVITTAVQFFETLAASKPSSLRKLHNLPGSAIFIDESHAVLPAKLWPQAWKWLKEYVHFWGCHLVMGSGSLTRFWKIEEFDKDTPNIPEILPSDFREKMCIFEEKRVEFKYEKEPFSTENLANWVNTLPGPRLLIVNTVQSAAVLADFFAIKWGRENVEHISTALMPKDRLNSLAKVKKRLSDSQDKDWILIATSCVEAGVDLSFRSGIREAASFTSLLQIAGRINRNSEYGDSSVWTIKLKYDSLLKEHPGFKNSSTVLFHLLETDPISPKQCTQALRRELLMEGAFNEDIIQHEKELSFHEVSEKFKVINADTRTVIIDEEAIKSLESGIHISWQELQTNSVQIWAYRIELLKLQEFSRFPGIYKWIYPYDDFIGYMKGVLKLEEIKSGAFLCL